MNFYKLENKKIVKCKDILEWGEWLEKKADRKVGCTFITTDIEVSTVFLGIDYAYGFRQKPILFETMIFGGKHDQEQWRYCTYEEAEKGHKKIVRWLRKELKSK